MGCNFEKNKHLNAMRSNEIDFDEVEYKAIKDAKEYYGDSIFDDIYLPENYDLSCLDTEVLPKKFDLQEMKLPFDNKTIQNMIKMPKILINNVFCFKDKGKLIHGSYLLGKNDGKYALFLLKIESSCEYKNFSKVSIKLDACIQGKAWFSLMRLDSVGHPHPNYVKNNKVVDNEEDLTYARTPHLHRADYYTQVVTDTLSYSLAKELPFFDYDKNVSDKFMFKKFVNYFLKTCNIKAKIYDNVKKDYFFSETQPLFDYDVPNIDKPKDIEGMEF